MRQKPGQPFPLVLSLAVPEFSAKVQPLTTLTHHAACLWGTGFSDVGGRGGEGEGTTDPALIISILLFQAHEWWF